MDSLHQVLETYCKLRHFDSIYDFVMAHDKAARAYSTNIRLKKSIPSKERLERWGKLLKLSKDGIDRLIEAAEHDRVQASIMRKTRMAPALLILQAELAEARSDLTSKDQQLVELRAVLRDIVAKCSDIKLSDEQLAMLNG